MFDEPRDLRMRQVERQYVDFVVVVKSAQLDSGDHANSQSIARRTRRLNSADRVMIG